MERVFSSGGMSLIYFVDYSVRKKYNLSILTKKFATMVLILESTKLISKSYPTSSIPCSLNLYFHPYNAVSNTQVEMCSGNVQLDKT